MDKVENSPLAGNVDSPEAGSYVAYVFPESTSNLTKYLPIRRSGCADAGHQLRAGYRMETGRAQDCLHDHGRGAALRLRRPACR